MGQGENSTESDKGGQLTHTTLEDLMKLPEYKSKEKLESEAKEEKERLEREAAKAAAEKQISEIFQK